MRILRWLCLSLLLTNVLPSASLVEAVHDVTHAHLMACSIPQAHPVVLSCWDSHLLQLLGEWYDRLGAANITRMVVLAMDEATMLHCQSLNATCIEAQGGASDFGVTVYTAAWVLLEAGCDVLFTSSSTYWFINPMPHLGGVPARAAQSPLLPPVFFHHRTDKLLVDLEIASYALHPQINENFFLARSNIRSSCFFRQLRWAILDHPSLATGIVLDTMLPNVHMLDTVAPSNCTLSWRKLSTDLFATYDGSTYDGSTHDGRYVITDAKMNPTTTQSPPPPLSLHLPPSSPSHPVAAVLPRLSR
jgi:hypothetical protein